MKQAPVSMATQLTALATAWIRRPTASGMFSFTHVGPTKASLFAARPLPVHLVTIERQAATVSGISVWRVVSLIPPSMKQACGFSASTSALKRASIWGSVFPETPLLLVVIALPPRPERPELIEVISGFIHGVGPGMPAVIESPINTTRSAPLIRMLTVGWGPQYGLRRRFVHGNWHCQISVRKS